MFTGRASVPLRPPTSRAILIYHHSSYPPQSAICNLQSHSVRGPPMIVRRLLWVVIALLLVAVLAGAGGLAWLLLRDRTPPIRLVAVGPNTQIRLIGGGDERVLVSDAGDAGELNFAFPAPSPDGQRLAYVTKDANGRAIMRLDLATGERQELYRSREDLPYDMAWSPDGKYLVFLVGSS